MNARKTNCKKMLKNKKKLNKKKKIIMKNFRKPIDTAFHLLFISGMLQQYTRIFYECNR